MIMDNLYTSHADYGSLNPKLARAFDWLKANDLKAIPAGQTIVVDGDRISAQIQAYDTLPPQKMRFEAHRAYIDIQIVVSGSETIYWAPLSRLPKIETPYDFAKDVVFFHDAEISVPLRLEAGDYTVFFPTDGHKPRCVADTPQSIGKIVMKIAV